jgi:hypothetical protein
MQYDQFSCVDGKCRAGQRPAVSRADFRREILPDDFADASYLEQEDFRDRLAAYRRGEFYFLGVRAAATVPIPMDGHYILHEVRSPGLWGIESDANEAYLNTLFAEEARVLEAMLGTLGVRIDCGGRTVGDIPKHTKEGGG